MRIYSTSTVRTLCYDRVGPLGTVQEGVSEVITPVDTPFQGP